MFLIGMLLGVGALAVLPSVFWCVSLLLFLCVGLFNGLVASNVEYLTGQRRSRADEEEGLLSLSAAESGEMGVQQYDAHDSEGADNVLGLNVTGAMVDPWHYGSRFLQVKAIASGGALIGVSEDGDRQRGGDDIPDFAEPSSLQRRPSRGGADREEQEQEYSV